MRAIALAFLILMGPAMSGFSGGLLGAAEYGRGDVLRGKDVPQPVRPEDDAFAYTFELAQKIEAGELTLDEAKELLKQRAPDGYNSRFGAARDMHTPVDPFEVKKR